MVDAYSGSLELLDAARTWAIWDKRRLANEGLKKWTRRSTARPAILKPASFVLHRPGICLFFITPGTGRE